MRLFEHLRIAVRIVAFLLNTTVCWLLLELSTLLRLNTPIEVIYTWTSRWSRINLRIFGAHVDCNSPLPSNTTLHPASDADGVGYIFVSNHRSGMDIPIILTLVKAHVISRHDLATWPYLGFLARRVRTLFVDRESRRSGASVLKEVGKVLAQGEGVAMFPEGTAFPGDEVHEFRTGAFNAARRAGAKIVPIGIAYSDEDAYYQKETFLTHLKRVACIRKHKVAVEIGQPVLMGDYTSIEMKKNCKRTGSATR